MPDPYKLLPLTEARVAVGLTLDEMAHVCGLHGTKSRESAGAWERGQSVPHVRRRAQFIEYLGSVLRLRHDPAKFQELWTVLVDEWGWQPVSDEEWRQHFGEDQPPVSAPLLPEPVFAIAPATLAAAEARLQQMRAAADVLPSHAPLPPGSRMPFRCNPLFVGRTHELQSIAQALILNNQNDASPATVVLVGIGGIGKTQLASEFVHRYGQFFAGGVFWLRCADTAAIPTEVALCGGAAFLNLHPDFDSLPLPAQVRLVQAAWQSDLPRLLVFDNCEDEELLEEWRPRAGGSCVLVTSRRAEWDVVLGVYPLPIRELRRGDSLALLQQLCPNLAMNNPDLDAIAAELGDLPLALHLAGSFLQRYRHAVTAAAYLTDLRAKPSVAHRSLQVGGVSPTHHDQHVARTFALSYDRLDPANAIDQLARMLLACTAHFAGGEPIDRRLLQLALSMIDREWSDLELEDARLRLSELGLVTPEADGTIKVHRLVVAYLCQYAPNTQARDAVERALLIVARQLNQYDSPPSALLLTHLTAVIEHALTRKDERAAELSYELSVLFYQIDGYERAIHYNQRSLALRTALYGPAHPAIVENLHHQGWIVDTLGRHSEAECYHQRALEIRAATAGHDHPDTAESWNYVGTARHAHSNYAGARYCYEQALAIREQRYGDTHLATASSLANLALLLQFQGHYAAAEPLHQRALAIREQLLGPDHHKVALSLNTLGYLYRRLARYAEAEEYLQRALTIRIAVFGATNSYIAVTLNHLGRLRQAQGDYEAARRYLQQALAIRELALGLDHYDTANSVGNLGMLLFDQGEYEAAQPYVERALVMHQDKLGLFHRHTARSLNHLGMLRHVEGRRGEARQCFERTIMVRERILGPEHPDTANTLGHLGMVLLEYNEESSARQMLQRALTTHQQALGVDHPYTCRSRMHLGRILIKWSKEDGQSYLQEALTYYEQRLGVKHPYTEMCRCYLNNVR